MEPGEPDAPMVGPLWKTRLCNFHAAGGCRNSSSCPFAHSEADLRPSPDFERTSVCPTLLSHGQCDRPRCRYAHHTEELRVQKGLLKTKMCAFYQKHHCIVGEACRFAHSEREIEEAVAMQQTAAQGLHQPPQPAVEPAAQERAMWQLRRSAFVCPRNAEAAREAGPPAPSAAGGSGPELARVPLPAFSLAAPPSLLELPARVSDCKVVIDAGVAEIEGVADIEEGVIASSALLESGLPQKVPLPAPYSTQLLARVVTLEEDIAELAPREPAATPRSREEALRCVCGAELSSDQRFCSDCGTRAPARRVGAGAAPASGLVDAPACGVFDSKVVIDTSHAEIEDMVFDIEEEVIANSVLLKSGLPQKVLLRALYSTQLSARVLTLEEEIAEQCSRFLNEPAATSRSSVPKLAAPPPEIVDDATVVLDIEDLRDGLVAELARARLELGQPGAPPAAPGGPGAPAALGVASSGRSPTRAGHSPRI